MSRQITYKPHFILLECVQGGGPFVFGERYYARRAHRALPTQAYFDIVMDGDPEIIRTEPDSRFIPKNPANWRYFGSLQRLRYAPATYERRAA